MTALVDIVTRILRYWFIWTLVGLGMAYKNYSAFLQDEKNTADAQIQTQEEVIRKTAAKVETYQQQKPKIAEKQAQVRKLSSDLDILLNQLPRDFNIAQILRKMNELGKGSSLDFQTFKPNVEKVSTQGFYSEMPIEMKLQGSFPQILLFFDRLSKQQRIINITGLKFKSVLDKGSYFLTEVAATASTYRYIEDSNFATQAKPAEAKKP